MTAYQQFARMSEMEPEERQKTREQLLAYCKQDTWAMAVILHGLEKRL
jgi:nucleoid-associated protein YejK